MVAYFKRQTWLFMLGGFAIGMLIAAASWNTILTREQVFSKLAFVMLMALLGIVIGRIQAAKWANKRLARLSAKLYDERDPEGFLREFEPIAARVPRDNVAFADAQTKVSFACEAMGDFEKALSVLESVKPDEMKMHSIHAKAILLNQKTRVLLMKEDVPGAEASLREMEALETEASARAKMLGEQLHACNQLARNWLTFLQGEAPDVAYLKEEAELAKNDIYRAEMELLLGRVSEAAGDKESARTYYAQADQHGGKLYAGTQAAARLTAL